MAKTLPGEFRVPGSFATFAMLGECGPDRDMEWGIPAPLRRERPDRRGNGDLVYASRYAANVLSCLYEVAEAQSVKSDSVREAKRIMAWVRKKRTELGH